MARIIRPTERVVQGPGPLSSGDARSAAASASSIGDVQSQVGQQIANLNQEFLNQATSAIQSASYSKAYSNANIEFAKRAQERFSQTVDEDGNPTFQRLPQDIQVIGDEIRNEIAKGIIDPEVRSRFETNFSGFVSNQQILALSRARQQGIDYTRGTIQESLDKLATQAVYDDPSSLENYKAEAQDILGGAAQGGVLSVQERDNLQNSFNKTVTTEYVRSLIDTDPTKTKAQLQDPEAFNDLDLRTRQRLIEEAEAGERDQARQFAARQKEMDRVQKEQAKVLEEEIKLGIESGTIGEADVLAAHEAGKISDLQRAKLQRFILSENSKQSSAKEVSRQISAKLDSGEPLYQFTPQQIDKHYTEALSLFQDENGNPPDMVTKAKIVQKYNAPVTAFTKELEYNLTFGDPAQATEALRAYEVVDKKSAIVVDKMDKRSKAIAATAQLWRQNTAISDADALARARESVLDVDDNVRKERLAEFKRIDDFKDENVRDTTSDLFDSFFRFEPDLSPGMTAITKDLFREAYVLTGDEKAAKQFVKHEISKIFGETEFNGGGVMMAFAPEKMTGLPSDALKADLMDSVKTLVPEGTEEDDIVVQSNQFTRTADGSYRYPVFTKGKFGELTPIVDEDGIPQWWTPDTEAIRTDIKQKQLTKELEKGKTKKSIHDKLQGGPSLPLFKNLKSILNKIAPISKTAPVLKESTLQTLDMYGINTPERMEHFFAQLAHESGGMKFLEERPSRFSGKGFEKYGPGTRIGRNLGNTQPGDGARYKGRGYIQLTGRHNYRQIGRMIGVDLENNPHLAAKPEIAIAVAAAYWKSRGLNELADRDDINRITKKINGGYNGLSDRKAKLRKIRGE